MNYGMGILNISPCYSVLWSSQNCINPSHNCVRIKTVYWPTFTRDEEKIEVYSHAKCKVQSQKCTIKHTVRNEPLIG
jgi:hypothetical protein